MRDKLQLALCGIADIDRQLIMLFKIKYEFALRGFQNELKKKLNIFQLCENFTKQNRGG
jgi:hypothetical protein